MLVAQPYSLSLSLSLSLARSLARDICSLPRTILIIILSSSPSSLPSFIWFRVQVTGFGADVGEALTTHPQVQSIAFTGSTRTGSRIMANVRKPLSPYSHCVSCYRYRSLVALHMWILVVLVRYRQHSFIYSHTRGRWYYTRCSCAVPVAKSLSHSSCIRYFLLIVWPWLYLTPFSSLAHLTCISCLLHWIFMCWAIWIDIVIYSSPARVHRCCVWYFCAAAERYCRLLIYSLVLLHWIFYVLADMERHRNLFITRSISCFPYFMCWPIWSDIVIYSPLARLACISCFLHSIFYVLCDIVIYSPLARLACISCLLHWIFYVLADMDRYRNLFTTLSHTPMLRLIFLSCCCTLLLLVDLFSRSLACDILCVVIS